MPRIRTEGPSIIAWHLRYPPLEIVAAIGSYRQPAIVHDEPLTTDVEVLQEVLHRYLVIQQLEAIGPAWEAIIGVVGVIHPVEGEDVSRARRLIAARPRSLRATPCMWQSCSATASPGSSRSTPASTASSGSSGSARESHAVGALVRRSAGPAGRGRR